MSKKKQVETKEVAIAQTTAVSMPVNLDEWGAPPVLSQKDTIIPKILPMQLMSKKVAAGQGAFGELRDSVTNECYGTFTKPMEFIPFMLQTVWIEKEYTKEKNEWVYKRTVPVTPENDNLPYEEGSIKRIRTLNFFVLRPEELKEGKSLPKILSFKITSLRGGRKLATQMFVSNRAANLSPAGMVMKLIVGKDSNDKGTFATLDVEQVRASSDAEQTAALQWFKTIKGPNNYKADESDLVEDTPEDSVPGNTGKF
jgi:hypothetical protein